MNYLSVCSGIEAASVAWGPLGWTPWAFAEVDTFPSAVLAHHYSNVPNLGDMTKFQEWPDADVDVLVGGTPCQSFSVAGLRAGLDDPRGGLMLTYLAIARRYRPRWVVWENVPGVLSSDGGRAFGSLLGGLAELGYGFAYRVLDAQHFGLAQRRQRVFVVGHLGDWRRAAAVLFERASLSGHPAPRREAGQVAPTVPSRRTGGGGLETDFDCDGGLIPSTGNVSHCLNAGGMGRIDYETETLISHSVTGTLACSGGHAYSGTSAQDAGEGFLVAHSLRADGFDASEDGTGRGTPLVPVISHTLDTFSAGRCTEDGTGRGCPIVPVAHAFDARQSDVIQYGDQTGPLDTDGHTIGALASGYHETGQGWWTEGPLGLRAEPGGMPENVIVGVDELKSRPVVGDVGATPTADSRLCVRRLTPRECERLQGFPDDYTLIPYRGKPAADGPRYKALGNSMAVPVMRWIGQRIAQVDAL